MKWLFLMIFLDTALVLTYKGHGLFPECDTVKCTAIIRSGPSEWYIKGIDNKDYWSEKEPKLIKGKVK